MKAEVIGWVVTAVATPIVTVTLCWTLVIFHYHRLYWQGTDVLLAALLSQGIIKQVATFAYALLTLLQQEGWCSGVVWLLSSVHTLQAATLATLTFSRLLGVRAPDKYRHAVKKTHLIYHLASLSVLSCCIGLAAVLAERNECSFLPHMMDRRYAILSLTLHSLLDIASLVALVVTLISWCCLCRRHKSNMSVSQPSTMMTVGGQLLTSSSDLSDFSLTSRGLLASNLRYVEGRSPKATSLDALPVFPEEPYTRWNSESSYISTSTSSTNSRAPCLARQQARDEDLRLPSVVPIILLCYLANHLPVLGLSLVGMFAPSLLPAVWSLPALVLWAGLAEEFLLPILLALCDRNFTAWVANIYTWRDRRVADLARQHQGLDGKFRVFNPQQSDLQPPNPHQQVQQQPHHQQQQLQQEPVKFPITNGSLFTSVDGRLPIIHNYRRGKGVRTSAVVPPHYMAANTRRSEMLQNLISLNSRTQPPVDVPKPGQETDTDTIEKKVFPASREDSGSLLLSEYGLSNQQDDVNSEDLTEYNVDDDNDDDDDEPIYATLSSRSCCSATTAANDDFEFFQHEEKMEYQRENEPWTVDQLKMVLSPYCEDAIAQTAASEILKTVIENELKSRRRVGDKGSSCESLNCKPHKKQSLMAGSLSLNNLDELLLEEEEPSDNSPEEREVVFQLPVKSESEMSLYRLDLDNKNKASAKEISSRRFHRQVPLNKQTPPPRRMQRQKKLPVPVLSVESLTCALNRSGVSYLDNGDLCRHGSVPDLKRVFVSDYL